MAGVGRGAVDGLAPFRPHPLLVVGLGARWRSRRVAVDRPFLLVAMRGGALPQVYRLRIASAAARMIQEGQVIILDSGTTTTAIARACKQFRSLTVITNGTNIAEELAGTSVEVILTGGTLRKNSF